MAKKILNLIYRVKDEGSKSLRKMKGEQKGLRAEFKAAGPVIAATGVAMAAVSKIGYELMTGWMDHTLAIGSFASQLGITTEETSVLMEVMDDFAITEDTMLAAMRTLAKQGFDPGIEALVQVREKLDATTSASERLALAQRLIGEQGIKQLLPMLDQLTDEQLRDYVETLTDAEMVTMAEYEAAQELKKALQDMGDAFDNLKLSIGGLIAGPVTGFLDFLNRPLSVDSWIFAMGDIFPNFPDLITNVSTSTEVGLMKMWEMMNSYKDVVVEARDEIVDLTQKQYLQKVAEALIAGDTALANHYLGLAQQAGQAGDLVERLMEKLLEYDGMKVTGEMELIARGFTPQTFINLAEQTEIMARRQADYLAALQNTYVPPPPTSYTKPAAGFGADVWATMAGFQHGGRFKVGGFGGPDSQLVQFRASPGEEVTVGGGDMSGAVLAEIRRLVNILPIAVRDAVERA